MIRLILADDHPVFRSGLRAVLEAEPDLDVTAVAASGAEALSAATEHRPDVAVLDLNMPGGDGLSVTAQIRAVARGEAVFGSGIAARMLAHFSRAAASAPFPQLTEREHEVLRLIAGGADNTTVARRLAVSGKTVRNHVSNIITKLQVVDRAGAILRARDAGLGGNASEAR